MSNPFANLFTRRKRPSADTLPPQGLIYFDHLYAEYESLTVDHPEIASEKVRTLVSELLAKRKDKTLSWKDLYTFDLILAQLSPIGKLSRKVWSLRSRYRDVAGTKEYDAYLASKPPDWSPGKTAEDKEDELRADIEHLLGELYLRYAIVPVRERIRDRIAKRVALGTLFWLTLAVMFTLLVNRPEEEVRAKGGSPSGKFSPSSTLVVKVRGEEIEVRAATLTVVIFVGAMGGLVSMQQRYHSLPEDGDQIQNVSELIQGWLNIFLPSISGAIFAVILYLLVLAGLLQGGLFPKMIEVPGNVDTRYGVNFLYFLREANPASRTDFAKLLVWSFISGFAERFIPDTLSRFIARKDSNVTT